METPTAIAFDDLVRAYLDELLRLDPLTATATGRHDQDHRWPDFSEAGRAATAASNERWVRVFRDLDPAELPAEARLDRELVLAHLAADHHALLEDPDACWDPLSWVYALGSGLFMLLARDFAPAAVRLDSLAGRLEGLPVVLDSARRRLGSDPGRPVSRLHTERALLDLPGIVALVDEVEALAASLDADAAGAVLLARVPVAAGAARGAIDAFAAHLRDVLLPMAEGEGRLGPERYAAKLAHTLGDPSLTAADVLVAAERQFVAVRREMARLSAAMWPSARPGEPLPTDPDALTRAMLAVVAEDHAAADEILQVARDALVRIEAFCRERSIIGLVDEPLDVEWTPIFLRGWAQAMLSSPGPLDAGQKSFYHITPIPDDWSDEDRESYLREMNRHQLDVLTIHEAVPGHYLQGVYANRAGSLVRSVLSDGAYAEGWAVYVTQVMVDAGYGADDPRLALAHWKYYLRAVVNAIVDIRIHTAGMTEAEAMDLMTNGGFQETAEARAKYSRARLMSTQLSTYFVGSLGFWALEHEARRRAAAASGDPRGADAVPVPPIVGGYPPTPGFDHRAHLEAVIGRGSLPLPLLRRAMLGD